MSTEPTNPPIPNQEEVWDEEHSIRLYSGDRSGQLGDVPNQSGQLFLQYFPVASRFLEVGSAEGADARYWAKHGHFTYCLDFSDVALRRLNELAEKQKVSEKIRTIKWDVAQGELPQLDDAQLLDGFFARSSLHIGDEAMRRLASQITARLRKGGIILIEGKSNSDPKIVRSKQVGSNLALDEQENGHLRRVWTPEFMKLIARENGWNIESIEDREEEINGQKPNFIRLIAKKV